MKNIVIIAGLIIAILGLLWWQGNRAETDSDLPDQDITLSPTTSQDRADRFLQDQDITIPDNTTRLNLISPTNQSDTGVVTLSQDQPPILTVLASLPDIDSNAYQVWLNPDSDNPTLLGAMRPAKGGYLLETQLSPDAQLLTLSITHQPSSANTPSTPVLKTE